jgi:hypothetical protein
MNGKEFLDYLKSIPEERDRDMNKLKIFLTKTRTVKGYIIISFTYLRP